MKYLRYVDTTPTDPGMDHASVWYDSKGDKSYYFGTSTIIYLTASGNGAILINGDCENCDSVYVVDNGMTVLRDSAADVTINSTKYYAYYDDKALYFVTTDTSSMSVGDEFTTDVYELEDGEMAKTFDGLTMRINSKVSSGKHAEFITYTSSSTFVKTTDNTVETIEATDYEDNSTITSIIIPEGVVTIGEKAFDSSSNLTSVSFPSTLTSIGEKAFKETSISELQIPGNVKIIGVDSFRSIDTLTSITLDYGVENLGDGCFSYNVNLTSVSLPESILRIGGDAFNEDTSLSSITIPSSVTEIYNTTFNGCTSLVQIKYSGTIAQWNELTNNSQGWYSGTPIRTVVCSDGTIELTNQ